MIKDPDTLTRLRAEWAGVTKMIERMKMLLAGTFAGGAFTAPALGGIVYNLPLLLAFDVLAQTLRALRDQNEFKCRSDSLGRLLEAGKGTVSWVDWQAIRTGVDLRNAVAHAGKITLSHKDRKADLLSCYLGYWLFIVAIIMPP